jgi:thiosulfate dehydrogenase
MAKSFILGIIFTLISIAAVGYVALSRGAIPANADAPASAAEKFIAGTDLRAVLHADAPRQSNPIVLTDANLIAGIRLYATHCVICHGSVAGKPSPIARGEYPKPPQFAINGVEDDPEGWTFWKIKHGIRWTGMPAWKDELTDQQIWTLTLFLKHMDNLPSAVKAAWQKSDQQNHGLEFESPAGSVTHPSSDH